MIDAKKSLSQNFLIDKNISNKIVNQVNVRNKNILEIGPGYGFLTDNILKKNPKKIFLIEKDFKLKKFLTDKYKDNPKINIVGEDILLFELNNFKNLIIISNLPYNISTKVILYLFNFHDNISEMVFMIQKEVSHKFDYNLPKMNKYKFLTRVVTTFNRCFDVSSRVFIPKPKVTSTVVKFNFNRKNIDLVKAYYFSNLIFRNVRKKISNNLKKEINMKYINKRVNELNIDELLTIYNLF
ncbi:16S rRNA (adenine(1518)-N(6)/adenine(1519)-N(6))-dimethyltransferase RsmA [Pelagibacteraceae bacterium]|nr:16S rRNA (adenine(1518)-N(6)/adenine(1519)-N(6))-dimethyltransferase RsmA [Pelagibacteraceae bacterium]